MGAIEKKSGVWTMVITPESGAKLLQISRDGKTFLWNATLPSTEAWCVGGERTWLAPEYGEQGFFFSNSATASMVPQLLDPGKYVCMGETDTSAFYENRVSLKSKGGELFHLVVRRMMEIRNAEETKAAFHITSTLENKGMCTFSYPIGLWELLQVPAIPQAVCRIGTVASPDLVNCIRPGRITPLRSGDGFVFLPALTETETKVGLNAMEADGTLEYHNSKSRYSIHFSMAVPPDPLRDYADKPARTIDSKGDAVQVYSSGNSVAKPFCELELHAPSVKLAPGETTTFSVILCCFDEDKPDELS